MLPALPSPNSHLDQPNSNRVLQLAIAFLLGICTALFAARLYQGRLTRPMDVYPSAFQLDLNSASPQQLMQLPRIGPAMASRIIETRPYNDVNDLRRVSGLGPVTLEKIKPHVEVVPKAVTYSAKPELYQPIDINTATLAELQVLPGIGPKLAQRIHDERVKKLFTNIDDLRRVPGIGPKTLEKLRPHIIVD